jgi:porin
VGGYYDSNRYAHLDDPRRSQVGNYGFYLLGDQMVFREGKVDDGQGLSLYAAFMYAPPESVNTLPYFASAGASYQGAVPGRDEDVAVFALYYGGFSRALPGQTYELTLEWSYAIKVTRWLAVQPDVQYVIRPSGRSGLGNALVIGGQLSLGF